MSLTLQKSGTDFSLRPMRKDVGDTKASVKIGDQVMYSNATSRNNPLSHPHLLYSHRGRVAATPTGAPETEKPLRKNSRNAVLHK